MPHPSILIEGWGTDASVVSHPPSPFVPYNPLNQAGAVPSEEKTGEFFLFFSAGPPFHLTARRETAIMTVVLENPGALGGALRGRANPEMPEKRLSWSRF